MLDLAINHVPQLQARYRETLFDERYKFYRRSPGFEYFLPIMDNCSDGVQYVSIDNGEVIGYLSVKFNRLTQTAYDLEVIKFASGYSPTFSQDMAEFDLMLFYQLGINRLVWSVVVGNPAERFYDELTNVCGVRVVGVFKNEVTLTDGQLYDLKFYELLKDDFFNAIKQKGVNVFNYRDLSKGGATNE